MSNVAPPPRQDKELTGHTWQEWFRQIWTQVNNMFNYDLNAIAAGAVPGKTAMTSIAWAEDVNNTPVDVWYNGTATPTAYVFPTTALTMSVVSTSAADAAAGTGIRTVEVNYLDSNFVEKDYIFTMNGVTPVAGPTDVYRVNFLYAISVGSTGQAVGNISLTSGGVTYAAIPALHNKAPLSAYTVPINKTLYITTWETASGTSTGTHFTRFWLRATVDKENRYTPGVFQSIDISGTLNGSFASTEQPPLKCPSKTDIIVRVQSDAGAAHAGVSSYISGWLE